MSVRLDQFQYYLPKKISLKKNFIEKKWDYKKIFNSTGIKFIRKTQQNETSFDLGLNASKKIFKKFPKKKIDGLIFVSQSLETNLPSSSCKLQYKLELRKNILTFDINQGCSGFVYGLSVANSLILNMQAKNILLVCSDTYTKYINFNDKVSYPIFSDGASATIISKNKKSNIIDFEYLTIGEGHSDLCLNKDSRLYMNGKKVLMFTMEEVPKVVNKILKRNNLKIKDIDHFIFHQASKVVLDNLKRKIKIDEEKFHVNISKIGNTVSSTIPILFCDLLKKKKIKRGDTILIAGFGVGLSIAASIIKF